MSRYRTISIKMWGDDRFSRLSQPQPNAQTLWFYLLTGPHTSIIPGAFVAGEAGLAEALKWPLKAFRKAFGEILAEGLVEFDPNTRLIFIPKAIRHNAPQSPNVVISWRKAFDDLPDCRLKQRIFAVFEVELTALGKGEGFVKAFGEAFTHTFANTEQYQEQYQEQEHDISGSKAPVELFEIYNRSRGVLPECRVFTSKRKATCRTRMASNNGTYLADFETAVVKASKTPFLAGAGSHGWFANFDWFIRNDENVQKVLEGHYDRIAKSKAQQRTERQNQAMREVAEWADAPDGRNLLDE